jgi:F-type H+-transporting ATPase subunit epsilon
LTDLKIGNVWFEADLERKTIVVSGGFVEVLPDRVTILADSAEWPEDIDEERAEKARQKAMLRLEEAKKLPPHNQDKVEILEAELKLQRAMNRLKMARTKRKNN